MREAWPGASMAAASNAASSEMGSAVGGATALACRLAGLDPMLGSPLHFDKIWNLETVDLDSPPRSEGQA